MLLLGRNYVFRVDPTISDYSRLFWTCQASTSSDLPIKLRLSRKWVSPLVLCHSCGTKNVKFWQNSDKGDERAEGDEDEGGEGDKGGERFVEDS